MPAAIDPTAEQTAIQTSTASTIVVRANAGAAKTTTLALRVGEALAHGVAPHRLLALTYTEPACRALRQAFARIGIAAPAAARVQVLTFDAFAAGVLLGIERQGPPLLGRPEELAPWIEQAARERDLPTDSGFVERYLALSRRLKGTLQLDLASWDGRSANAALAEDLEVEPEMLRLHLAVEHLRYPQREGSDRPRYRAPFDATYDLARLLADPEPTTWLHELAAWPRDLDTVLVDEMHDLNLAMFTILRTLLADRPTRFCGVGDDDQVIHASAGAERRFMDADTDFGPGRRVTVLPLTASFRFDAGLARGAGRLAGKPYASGASHATRLACRAYDGDEACAALVVECAAHWRDQPGARLSDLVVLLRHPCQSVLLENALVSAGLDYTTAGFDSYLMQPEVLLIRALLALAAGDFAALESAATRRALVHAVVFFCDVKLGHAVSEAETPQQRLAQAAAAVAADAGSLQPFFEYQVLREGDPVVARRIEAALAAARAAPGPEGFGRMLDALRLDELVARRFVERQRRADALAYIAGMRQAARAHASIEGFLRSLQQAEARVTRGRPGASTSPQKDALRSAALKKSTLLLATVEAVKGLEFGHVVLPWLAQGEFPARLAASHAEERNRCYVAITRACRALTLLVDRQRPSEFVAAIGAAPGP